MPISRKITQELIDKSRARVEEKPKSPQLIYMLASFAMGNQDLAQAELYYRKLLALEPRSPQILAELAQVLFVKSQNGHRRSARYGEGCPEHSA